MKSLPGRETSPSSTGELALDSIRAVIARKADVLWQADPAGAIAGITLCRPGLPESGGELDPAEVTQVDHLWRKAVKCAGRFSAVYHMRTPNAAALRTFLIQAVPVFDQRDEVLHWSGHATEVERFADSGTRFISDASAVLSSSLSRAAIVNRLIATAVEQICDLCAVHTLADDGSVHLEGIADRRAGVKVPATALDQPVADALRARQPLLLLASALREPGDERFAELLRATKMRSAIVVPLLVGSSCVGTLSFLESEGRASFAAREVDVAVVVGRQLALALENIKTFEREQQITQRFRFLARTTERLFTTGDSKKTMTLLMDALADGFADHALAVALTDGRLRVVAESGTKGAIRQESEGEMIASLAQRRSILSPLVKSSRPLSWMMVPVFSGDAVYGGIVCASDARQYDRSDLELLEEIGRRASLALGRAESVARERRLIETLQQATLPTQLASVEGASLSAIYRPAAVEVQVGGDWYEAFDLDDGRILLSVGDVTGHGLAASIVMGKLRHTINVVAMYERNPARILDATERILLRRYPGSVATAFVAIFDPRSHTLAYANAGHPFPLLRRSDGSIVELEADGLPLGLRSIGDPATPLAQRLDDAALLAFYTDGLTEATHDTLAGEKLLREAIGTEAVFFVDNPAQFVETYCLRAPSPDDVAVLVLNFVQSQRWKFEAADRHAAGLAQREFVSQLQARASAASDVNEAQLIFGELIATLDRPHVDVPLEIALEWKGYGAVLHVIERGQSDAAIAHPSGFWLAGRLGAQLRVELLPGYGTHVRAALPVTPRRG